MPIFKSWFQIQNDFTIFLSQLSEFSMSTTQTPSFIVFLKTQFTIPSWASSLVLKKVSNVAKISRARSCRARAAPAAFAHLPGRPPAQS